MKIAVVGATGAVGKELLKILDQRGFKVTELVPFASARSEGKPVMFRGQEYACRVLKPGCFAGIQIAFFDASDAISKEWVPEAVRAGAWAVDNSATFRLDSDVLLIVPEVNGELLDAKIESRKPLTERDRILTGPNCSTVQLVVALKPIHARFGIKRVVVSTYQSASGAGAAAMDELAAQAQGHFTGQTVAPKAFVHQIAFNCIPQIGGFKDDGTTSEEQKIIAESRKLLGLPTLRVAATAVRVPTFGCHGESVNVECERVVTVAEARDALRAQPGLVLQDDPARSVYPMGLTPSNSDVECATGRDAVYVGRVRQDTSVDHGVAFWIVSDNLRKGAALNAVQIGEQLVRALG